MPLTERDINTHRDAPRNKRHSIQQGISYSRLNDENTPSPAIRGKTTKTTPLSERLLAPTKSSAAKAAATTPRTPGPTTPQPRVNSKLPRRTTPNTAPSGTAKAASRPGSSSDTGEVTRDKVTAAGRTRLRQTTSRPESQTDKPLPPRPVVSLATTLSPTKDSRSLVDAIEKPLQQSVDEGLRDWPAMMPKPINDMATKGTMTYELEAPMTATSLGIFSPDRLDIGVLHSLVNRSVSACDDHETASDRSSSTTFLSAEDGNVLASAYNGDDTHALQRPSNSSERMMHGDCNESSPLGDGQLSHPRRDASLPAQYAHNLASNSSFDRELSPVDYNIVMPNTLGCNTDSRPHSPSPASFSRPRPSSISHGRGLPSPNTTATNAARVLRAQKTASRIPIPDPKKAMLVDVKSRTSAATQKSDHAPRFGSRRLDAPDTLKILDQGIKRRQMNQPKRTNTSHSTATTETSSTHTYVQSEYPAVDRSKTNTPENTFANSSSDEEEIVTPTYQVDFGTNTGHQDKLIDGRTNSYYHSAAVRLFDGAVSALGRTPPPTSPYTDPLQTIQSQVVLPTQDEGGTLLSASAHGRKPSDLKTLNKRLSELHNAHADYTAARIGDRARVPESIKYSLLELLNEYTNEDRHLSKEGHAGLDAETKKHITRTLSMLEGNGTPAHTDVDNETLLRLFGHLKRGLEKQPGSVSFADNAAAAEQFLAQPTGDAVESYDPSNAADAFYCPIVAHEANAADVESHLSSTEAIASKWSESTASVDASFPRSDHTPPGQKYAASRAGYAAPQRAPPEPPRSIGYPSRIASKANTLIGPGGSGPATPPAPIRRISSPTLGKSKPGSVRAARETMKGGFARTTASADSKKTSKLPSPSAKSLQLHEGGQRGRVPSAEEPRTLSDTPVASKTRSRSKSRYVMDKINGLFSSKRDKRGSTMPPIPSIAELDAMPDLNTDNTSDVSLVPRSARGPTGTKMPTMSPIIERAAIDTSRLDTPTSVNTPVDSVLAGDDGNQALQNWTATLVTKAARERDPVRKARLVSFAKVLNDSLISAREAQISAETAQHAAKSAQLSYEMTQQSVAMLQRLAASLTTRGPRR
ncbi:hypothetical protein LTR97_010425 [Elasticomyces elasticus]|uniref:Uncharacterized protein n=1 Tax=Elasticomyces elasticus TaxID=574655 RepID=A0AAN7W0D2_9PEZI|nr:hypothetical protein LTR97_010425 [Elasticomyces elasticus]